MFLEALLSFWGVALRLATRCLLAGSSTCHGVVGGVHKFQHLAPWRMDRASILCARPLLWSGCVFIFTAQGYHAGHIDVMLLCGHVTLSGVHLFPRLQATSPPSSHPFSLHILWKTGQLLPPVLVALRPLTLMRPCFRGFPRCQQDPRLLTEACGRFIGTGS